MLNQENIPDAISTGSAARSSLARRVGLFLLAFGLFAALALVLCRDCDLQGIWSEMKLRSRVWMPESLMSMLWTMLKVWPALIISPFLDPFLYGVFAVLFATERMFSARPQQARLSIGLIQDLCWFVMHRFLAVVVISVMMRGLNGLYQNHLSMLSIHAIQSWSLGFKIALVLLVNDFLDWFHHVVRHKVWVFWCFHAVHHSQREMNMFTDERVHVLDVAIANCLVCIPMFMVAVDAPMAVPFAMLLKWYPKLYHANIKANFGVLRYILVTPQSHRLHHSIEPHHRDKNFGVIFSFWDRIFGTLHPDCHTYPATGISDEEFPLERQVTGIRVIRNYVAQVVYPFAQIFRRWKGTAIRT